MTQESTLVKLPQMGEGIHEATLIRWFKKPGDKVSKDEPLLEIATDKVDTEIVAPASGFLIACFAKEGDLISVQQSLAQISPNAAAPLMQIEKTLSKKSSKTPSKEPIQDKKIGTVTSSQFSHTLNTPRAISQSIIAGPIRSSPLVRKIAKESGLNLADVRGSGLHGRVTKEDLFEHLNSQSPSHPTSFTGHDVHEPLFSLKTERRDNKEFLDGVEVQRTKMTRIRRLTAEHMLRSVRISPHVTTTFEIDFSEVVRAKKELEADFFTRFQSKLSFTAFFIHAAIKSLKEHPIINSSVDGEDILFKERINIACAVATDHGLIVPVLKNLNDCTLFEVAEKLNDTVRRAREKRLSPEDVQGGTFSITNPGIYGSLHSQPIINQPQVAILSTGAIVERPAVVKGEILIRPLVQVGLTFDHRIVDGEGGAKFLASLKHHLETQ